MIADLVQWTNNVFGNRGPLGLFLLAFAESSVFPIPPDLLLITLALADPSNSFFLSLICTIGSVLGGMFGYGIGYVGEKAVLEKLFDTKKIEKVHNLFQKYEWWVIFISGFTPIPYKLFTIGAGVFYVNFKKFVVASFFGRGLRFFLIGFFVYYFGDSVLSFMDKYFNEYTILISVIVILITVVYHKYGERIINWFSY